MTEVIRFPGVLEKKIPNKYIKNPAKEIMQMTHERTIATMNLADAVMSNIADGIAKIEGKTRLYQMSDDTVRRIAEGKTDRYFEYDSEEGVHAELMVLSPTGAIRAMCVIYKKNGMAYTVMDQNSGIWSKYKNHDILNLYKDNVKKDALIAYAIKDECCPCEIDFVFAEEFLRSNKRILRVYKRTGEGLSLATDDKRICIVDRAGNELYQQGRAFEISLAIAGKKNPPIGKMWTVKKACTACKVFMV